MSERKRREWTLLNDHRRRPSIWSGPSLAPNEFVEVREVLPGEITLTELELNYILDRTSLRLEQVIEVLRAVFHEGPHGRTETEGK